MQALIDPLLVRSSLDRHDRMKHEVGALQKHLAQIIDARDHVLPETDLYERFKMVDEQTFPRLALKISQRNWERVSPLVSSRGVMLRLRTKFCEYLLQDVWEWIPSRVSLLPEAAANVTEQAKSTVRDAFEAAGRFDGGLTADVEQFIEERLGATLQDALRRIVGTRLPTEPELSELIDGAVKRCIEGLEREGYATEGLTADVRAAAARSAELVCEVARSGAVLMFPSKGEPYDATSHDANDVSTDLAVVAAVTFPGLRRGDRVLHPPQIITTPRPESVQAELLVLPGLEEVVRDAREPQFINPDAPEAAASLDDVNAEADVPPTSEPTC
jgi:hypothetical protein